MVGLTITTFTATSTILARNWIAEQYTQDTFVITLAAHLIIFAAVYQFSDTVQAISSGALRGYKDTKIIFMITLIRITSYNVCYTKLLRLSLGSTTTQNIPL